MISFRPAVRPHDNPMNIITPDFIDRIIRSGELTEAQRRITHGLARPHHSDALERYSSWNLICEEILDTEHSPDWYDTIITELSRRGLSFELIDKMRHFAWKTVGWLNFDRVLWEWVSLDENDIKLAARSAAKEGLINREQHTDGMYFFEHPTSVPLIVRSDNH